MIRKSGCRFFRKDHAQAKAELASFAVQIVPRMMIIIEVPLLQLFREHAWGARAKT
jgi:hypothetical protein